MSDAALTELVREFQSSSCCSSAVGAVRQREACEDRKAGWVKGGGMAGGAGAGLQKLLTDAIVALCQRELSYAQELRIEGTVCVVSDGTAVVVTQITELLSDTTGVAHETPWLPGDPVAGDTGLTDETLETGLLGDRAAGAGACHDTPGRGLLGDSTFHTLDLRGFQGHPAAADTGVAQDTPGTQPEDTLKATDTVSARSSTRLGSVVSVTDVMVKKQTMYAMCSYYAINRAN